MTLFEYLAIAFGLLYSVAALRLLGGLPSALDRRTRSPLHIGLVLVNLFLVTISFWTFWSLREVEWTFAGFVIALSIPGLLYYCAAVLVPENPDDVASWRDHYFSAHRRWYGGLALWAVGAAASATVNLGMGVLHPARVVHVIALTAGVVGAATARPRVHATLLGLFGLLTLGALFAQLAPGWLARP